MPFTSSSTATVAGTPGVRSRASAMRPRPGRTRSTEVATYVHSRTGSLSPASSETHATAASVCAHHVCASTVLPKPTGASISVSAAGAKRSSSASSLRRISRSGRRRPSASFVSIRGSASGTPAAAEVGTHRLRIQAVSATRRPAHPGEFDAPRRSRPAGRFENVSLTKPPRRLPHGARSYDYPFLDILWTMLIFFCWIIWFWLLITIFADIFRRKDTSGFSKVLWIIFVIVLPFLGVFIYLIANHDGMAERSIKQAQAQQAQMDDYVRTTAGSGGAAAEIEKAKGLLDSGAITQAEFDAIKAKALA